MVDSNLNKQLFNIIERAKKGDQYAQAQIIELTQSKLFKFCILLGHNRELAEDLCQDVFIKAFKSMESLQNPLALQSWLYQIAKNLFIDHKRSRKDIEVEPKLFSDSDMETVLQVQQILSQFEKDDRFLLLFVEMEGMSYKEASEALDITEDAVRSRLHRLKLAFIKKFK